MCQWRESIVRDKNSVCLGKLQWEVEKSVRVCVCVYNRSVFDTLIHPDTVHKCFLLFTIPFRPHMVYAAFGISVLNERRILRGWKEINIYFGRNSATMVQKDASTSVIL